MARQSLSVPKSGALMQRCSRHFREQKNRFYIIWRCTVFLMRCEDRFWLCCPRNRWRTEISEYNEFFFNYVLCRRRVVSRLQLHSLCHEICSTKLFCFVTSLPTVEEPRNSVVYKYV